MALLAILVFIAVALTYTMFHSRDSMLGFPSALFWAIAGGQAYTLSTTTWDTLFLTAFGSLLGMTTFTALAAYGLREKRDSLANEELDERDGDGSHKGESDDSFFDEKPEPDLSLGSHSSGRVKGVRERAKKRRSDASGQTVKSTKKDFGEFS